MAGILMKTEALDIHLANGNMGKSNDRKKLQSIRASH
jgi:hypothetical protein